jgi:hypothetical protein
MTIVNVELDRLLKTLDIQFLRANLFAVELFPNFTFFSLHRLLMFYSTGAKIYKKIQNPK